MVEKDLTFTQKNHSLNEVAYMFICGDKGSVFWVMVEARKQLSNHLEEDLQMLIDFERESWGNFDFSYKYIILPYIEAFDDYKGWYLN